MDQKANPFLKYKKCGGCMFVDFEPVGAGEEAWAERTAEFADLCDRIAWDDEVRVVVLHFGGAMHDSLAALAARLKQPVIASVRGDAVGATLELALACDIRIGTENARFGLPQIREGRIPCGGGTQRLPRLIGRAKALEMILTGDLIDAEEALSLRLIHRVAAADKLTKTATEMAREMAAKSPLSLRFAKEALYHGTDLTLDQGLKMEMDLYLLLFGTRDRVEGITAFKEKRKPNFEGV